MPAYLLDVNGAWWSCNVPLVSPTGPSGLRTAERLAPFVLVTITRGHWRLKKHPGLLEMTRLTRLLSVKPGIWRV